MGDNQSGQSANLGNNQKEILKGQETESKLWQLTDISLDTRKALMEKAIETERIEKQFEKQVAIQETNMVGKLSLEMEAFDESSPEKRAEFMGEVKKRLSVLLVILIKKGLLTEDEVMKGDFLKQLEQKEEIDTKVLEALDPQEKDLLKLVQKILKKNGSKVKTEFSSQCWSEVTKNVEVISLTAGAALDFLSGKNPQEGEKKGYVQKTIDLIKNNPIPASIVLILGSCGAYYLLWGRKKEKTGIEEESSSKEGTLDKIWDWTKNLFLIGAGVFVAGKVLGSEKVWEKVTGLVSGLKDKIEKGSFLQALSSAQKGDFAGAAKILGAGVYAQVADVLKWPSQMGEKAGQVVEKGKEVVKDVYRELEQKLNLTEFKNKILAFAKEKFPNSTKKVEEMLAKLTPENIEKWAKGEGFQESKENLLDFLEKHKIPLAGFAGAYALLRIFAGQNIAGEIAVPAVVYFFATQAEEGTFLREYTKDVGGILDGVKNKVADKLDELGVPWAKDLLDDLEIKKNMEGMMDYLKENPLEATAYITTAWWFKTYIWQAFKFLSGVAFASIKNATKFSWDHPYAATALLALGYAKRREIVDQLVGLIPANAIEKKSLDSFHQILLKMIGGEEERSDKEEIFNDAVDVSLVDGGKAILENLKGTVDVIQAVRKGEIIMTITEGAHILWHTAKDLTPIGIGLKFTAAEIVEIADELINEDDTSVSGVLIPGVGAVFGAYATIKMTFEGAKAIRHISTLGSSTLGKGINLGKTAIPITQEARFLLRSMVKAPFIPVLKRLRAWTIGGIQDDLKVMEELLAKGDYEALGKKADAILKPVRTKTFKGQLEGSTFDQSIKERFHKIESALDEIQRSARYEQPDKAVIEKNLKLVNKEISVFRTELSNVIAKIEGIPRKIWQKITGKKGVPIEEPVSEIKESGEVKNEEPISEETKPKIQEGEKGTKTESTKSGEIKVEVEEVKISGEETVKVPKNSAVNKLRLSLLGKAPEQAGRLMMVYAAVTGVMEIREISKIKANLEEMRQELERAHPEEKENINAAIEDQLTLLTAQEVILGGNTTAAGAILTEETLKVLSVYLPKVAAVSEKLKILGPLALGVFVIFALADLAIYNSIQIPNLRKSIDQLAATIEKNKDTLPPKVVEESVKLILDQRYLVTEKQVGENIFKLINVAGLCVGASTLILAIAGTAFAASAGLASLALIVTGASYGAMYGSAMEAREDAVKTSTQWAEKEKDILLHDWVTTLLGSGKDSYRLINRAFNNENEKEQQKEGVRERIIIGLLSQEEKDPTRIENRKIYIKALTGNYYVNSYERAKILLEQSKIFADAVSKIDQVISRYEGKVKQTPSLNNQEILLNMKKIKKEGIKELDIKTAMAIQRTYEKMGGVVHLAEKVQDKEAANFKGLQKGIYELAKFLGFEKSPKEQEEKISLDICLLRFFDEAHKAQRGIYFSEGSWYVNNVGMAVPDSSDPEHTVLFLDYKAGNDENTLNKMIEYMGNNTGTILEDRLDSAFSWRDTDAKLMLRKKVQSMVQALKKGQEGEIEMKKAA